MDDTDDLLGPARFRALTLLSDKALRVYAERGLLVPRHVDPATGYRSYGADQVEPGWLIGLLRSAGLSLDQVAGILAADPASAVEHLDRVVAAQERRHEAGRVVLARARAHLAHTTGGAPVSTTTTSTVTTSTEPDVPVLSSLHHTAPAALDTLIPAEVERLSRLAEAAGLRVTGAPFGVFHAPVTEESSGPLEIALPVDDVVDLEDVVASPPGGVRSHRLGGGSFAGRTASGPETEYPALLAVYDEVRAWIVEAGHTPVGPPREVWLSAPGEPLRLAVRWPYAPAG